jgi:hypothetical protein
MGKIEGRLVSAQLGRFGSEDIVYGYIGIQTANGRQERVKVDKYTQYHEGIDLEIGVEVEIEVDHLGSTDIMVARHVRPISSKGTSKADSKATAATT